MISFINRNKPVSKNSDENVLVLFQTKMETKCLVVIIEKLLKVFW